MFDVPLIDIHSHFKNDENDKITVLNFTQNEYRGVSNIDEKYFSAGLHPWFLTEDNFKSDFEKLSQLIENQNFIALGECGLDRLKGVILDFQTKAFEAQIKLAEAYSKPVVIHCVRAFSEIISVKKRLKPRVPLVIHGFNQNENILKELLKNNFYISIGASVLNLESNAANSVRIIPISQLFFETDDKNLDIKSVYEKASMILGISLEELKSYIYKNFNAILTHP